MATFSIDVRAQKNEVLEQIQNDVEKGLKQVAMMFDSQIHWEWIDITPGAEVSTEAARIAECVDY